MKRYFLLLALISFPLITWAVSPAQDGQCLRSLTIHRPTLLRILRRHAQAQREFQEQYGHDMPWWVDGGPSPDPIDPKNYNVFFKKVLGQSLESVAQSRKLRGLSSHVADLLGSALFSSEPQVFDSLTGVRLLPIDPTQVLPIYKSLNWKEVTGDLLRVKTWRAVDGRLESLGIPYFDIIILRPFGPLLAAVGMMIRDDEAFRTYLGIFYFLLNEAWKRLSPNEGLLLVESPPWQDYLFSTPDEHWSWINKLRGTGIKFEDHYGRPGSQLKLIKMPDSPTELPKL